MGELDQAKLPDLLELKYKAVSDAAAELGGVAKPDETDQPNQVVPEPTDDSEPLLNALDQEWTS